LGLGYGLQEFSADEVYGATDGFAESAVVGEGGFGTVYRGRLRGLAVAVKRLSAHGLQSQAELHRELEVLSSINHPHIGTSHFALVRVRVRVRVSCFLAPVRPGVE